MSHVKLCFVLMSLFLTGCAATSFSKKNDVSLVTDSGIYKAYIPNYFAKNDRRIALHTDCGFPTPIMWMLSPIIPLPPIIPVWFLASDISHFDLTLEGDGFTYKDPEMKVVIEGRRIDSHVSHTWGNGKLIKLSFESSSCRDINSAELTFTGIHLDDQPVHLPVVNVDVKAGDYFFDVEYLRQ